MSVGPDEQERRSGDRRHTDWRDPKFWLTLILFAITLASYVWSASKKDTSDDLYIQELRRLNADVVMQLNGIKERQDSLAGQLAALAISGKGQEKEMDFLREQLAEFKTEQRDKAAMMEARIISLEKKSR